MLETKKKKNQSQCFEIEKGESRFRLKLATNYFIANTNSHNWNLSNADFVLRSLLVLFLCIRLADDDSVLPSKWTDEQFLGLMLRLSINIKLLIKFRLTVNCAAQYETICYCRDSKALTGIVEGFKRVNVTPEIREIIFKSHHKSNKTVSQ